MGMKAVMGGKNADVIFAKFVCLLLLGDPTPVHIDRDNAEEVIAECFELLKATCTEDFPLYKHREDTSKLVGQYFTFLCQEVSGWETTQLSGRSKEDLQEVAESLVHYFSTWLDTLPSTERQKASKGFAKK